MCSSHKTLRHDITSKNFLFLLQMFLLPKRVEGKVQGCRATDPRPPEKTSGLGEVSVLTDHFSSSRATELSCKCV